jgi:ribonucleases P/MRP protein subunit RPP40
MLVLIICAGVLSPEHEIIQVLPEVVELHDVHIPMPNLSPQTGGDESETEDWNEHISELYEWVGMSCLGAQR